MSNLWNLFNSQISSLLSFKDTLPNCFPINKIKPIKRLSVYAINARNILIADFAQRKEAAISFPLLLINTSIWNAIKQF